MADLQSPLPLSQGEVRMETIEYHTIDKSQWERGPWDDEPDKVQWRDEETGLPCLVVRGPHGALCGYVGVSPGHPWHGKDYDYCEAAEPDEDGYSYIDVHGGLTYADACSHNAPERSICHVVEPGEPDDVWWLGFDCAHSGDYTDMARDDAWRRRFPNSFGDVYRTIGYVRDECRKLAKQALAAGSRRAETAQQAQCEASQSGGEAVTPKTSNHPTTERE